MSLPVVDKESYQFSISEWVTYAGEALRHAGYLESEPTGLYDEEFAAAVTAFQAFHGITEENHVGPYTWAALGVEDAGSEHSETEQHSEASVQTGQLSEDGQWQWDGSQWAPAAVHSDLGIESFASAGTEITGHALTANGDPSVLEDVEIASLTLQHELAILRQWDAALDSFNEVMESETQKSAKPDFAKAMLKVFTDKVLGKFVKDTKAGVVFDVLKGLVGEAERAKNASKSVAFRDFYTTHRTHIANLDKELALKLGPFMATVRTESERLLRNDPAAYGMLRMELMDLYQDAERRLQTATQESLFAELSAEWVGGSVKGYIHIRVREADLSVIDVELRDTPDGDKLVEQLTQQPGGMDVWNMHAPKILIYMDANEHASGEVHLNAGNQLTNPPATQDGKYKKRYEQLIARGGLAPVHKH